MSVYRHFQCPLRVQIVHTHSRFSAFAQKLRPACSRYSCVQNNQIRLYLFQPRLQISFEATRYENRINFYSRNSVMARRGGIEEKKCAVTEQKQTVIKFGIAAFKTVMQAAGRVVGIYGATNGVLVLGSSPVETVDGSYREPAEHIVFAGDYITAVNGKRSKSKRNLLCIC